MINPICPNCKTSNTGVLKHPALIVCRSCQTPISINFKEPEEVKPSVIPEDWSFVQLNSSGEYKGQQFILVGRIRLQLRNDYKNFWCASLMDGSHFWLMESFSSFSVLQPEWTMYDETVQYLHAGKVVTLKDKTKVKGEFVEKCEGVSYEGELGDWKLFHRGFFFTQASSQAGATAIFTVNKQKQIEYLLGEKQSIEQLNLQNTIVWDEWK